MPLRSISVKDIYKLFTNETFDQVYYTDENGPQIHQYNWINPKRGEWSKYDSVITIVPSNYFREPNRYLSKFYSSFDLISTVEEFRNEKKTRNYFIYLLKK